MGLGSEAAVMGFIAHGANPDQWLKVTGADGGEVAVVAAQEQHARILEISLDHGASLNRRVYLFAPLITASKRSHAACVRLLLQRAWLQHSTRR